MTLIVVNAPYGKFFRVSITPIYFSGHFPTNNAERDPLHWGRRVPSVQTPIFSLIRRCPPPSCRLYSFPTLVCSLQRTPTTKRKPKRTPTSLSWMRLCRSTGGIVTRRCTPAATSTRAGGSTCSNLTTLTPCGVQNPCTTECTILDKGEAGEGRARSVGGARAASRSRVLDPFQSVLSPHLSLFRHAAADGSWAQH